MRIGVPRETKDGERRVAVTPAGARALVAAGHVVVVECGAGAGVGFADDEYRAAGATLTGDAAAAWGCPLIVKVKEIQRAEYPRLVPGTTVCSFAQLGRDPALLAAVLTAGVGVLGYETVRGRDGVAPLLAPMSRIAGRLAPFAGAMALGSDRGGAGVLITGIDDVPGARVLVIGAGTSGTEAARIAAAMGARVTLVSRGAERLAAAATMLAGAGLEVAAHVRVALSDEAFAALVADSDLIVGAVLEPGRLSPRLITRAHLRSMRRGSAFVDVGIDQGGIGETSRMTTLSEPTYVEEGIVHYAVPNMPSLVARTATLALAGAWLPWLRGLADRGVIGALAADPALAAGLMVWDGAIVDPRLAMDAGVAPRGAPWRA